MCIRWMRARIFLDLLLTQLIHPYLELPQAHNIHHQDLQLQTFRNTIGVFDWSNVFFTSFESFNNRGTSPCLSIYESYLFVFNKT
jgi:hypothetical protein